MKASAKGPSQDSGRMSIDLPIACTLTTDAYDARVSWIARLNRAHLRAHHRSGRTVELTYSPEATPLVHELVRREEECCAFLDFSLSESDGALRLSITVPERAREGSDALLAPFLQGAIE
jgi:hypothetical protein